MAAQNDTALIEARTAFAEIDTGILAYDMELAALSSPLYGEHTHPGEAECCIAADRIRDVRAVTLAGIAARVQTLLCCCPDPIEESDTEDHAEFQAAALLRELRDMLGVDATRNQDAVARGKQLARARAEAEHSDPARRFV